MKVSGALLTGLLAANDVAAFFKIPCSRPVVVQRADPIVNPGTLSGHVHTVMGGSGFDFNMTFEQARASSCSSCKVKQDLSNYWIPNLYYQGEDGKFTSVPQSGGMLIYYLLRSDPKDPEYNKGLLAYPEGFRMLAGDPKLRSFSNTLEQRAISYVCLGAGGQTNEFPNKNCKDGLRLQVVFPSCWNGKDLDSPDHKSHMAYPSGVSTGSCPQSHPKRFVTLFYEVIFGVNDFKDQWYGNQQPFVLSNGDHTGYGLHGDFLNGWDVDILQAAITNCTDNSGSLEKCGVLNETLFDDSTRNGCSIPVKVNEPVSGKLDALPGCNPVRRDSTNTAPQAECNATTETSQAQWGFKDVTKSLKFKHLGCAKDPSNPRTLPNAKKASDSMTVDMCVNYCNGLGYQYAGLEYAKECWCGNSVAEDRMPKKGIRGTCEMPCAGEKTTMCGGWAVMSLYQKCNGTCENAALM